MINIKFNTSILFFFSCLLIFSICSFADPQIISIKNNDTKLEEFKIGYFIDKTHSMSFQDAQQQIFTESPNKVSLGADAIVTWLKIELENTSLIPLKTYLHNSYAYRNHLTSLYEVVDSKVIRHQNINLYEKKRSKLMYRGTLVIDIDLKPQEHKILYMRIQSFTHQWFDISLYGEEYSKRALLGLQSGITIIVGMISGLIIYNLLLFFTVRTKENLYYACYLISGGVWLAYSYGLFANIFHSYGFISPLFDISLFCMPIFLLLFMTSIFKTKKKYPFQHKMLISVLILLVGLSIYSFFDLAGSFKCAALIAGIVMSTSFIVAISMFMNKEPTALLFLIARSLFVFFSSFSLFFYKGDVEFNYLNYHGVAFGILFEALVLSLIIAYRIRLLENLKAKQADLEVLASTDPLTKLFNRRYFESAADLILEQASISKTSTSIIIFDIDNFKNINDSYGHEVGDQVIKKVANMINSQIAVDDILARYGGEEFIVIMPDTTENQAYNISERIRFNIHNMRISMAEIKPFKLTVSAGVAEADAIKIDLQKTINDADKALYSSKNNGRNQTQKFSTL